MFDGEVVVVWAGAFVCLGREVDNEGGEVGGAGPGFRGSGGEGGAVKVYWGLDDGEFADFAGVRIGVRRVFLDAGHGGALAVDRGAVILVRVI